MSISELPLETIDISELCLLGVPIYYPKNVLPSDRYVWVEGQEFDIVENPLLAELYPTGVLPDPRYDFFKVVGNDGVALVKEEQSVQPLTFIGVAHTHQTYTSGRDNGNNGYDGNYTGGVKNPISQRVSPYNTAATVATGSIGGTGAKTQPQCMSWYCIMRIR